jgi:hypothetical protein
MSDAAVPMRAEHALAYARALVEKGMSESPVLVMSWDDGIALYPMIDCSPRDALDQMTTAIRMSAMPVIHWACLITDAYVLVTDTDEEMGQYAGQLDKMFNAGDPRVSEAITVMMISSNGTNYLVQQPYLRDHDLQDETQHVAWGQVQELPVEEAGGILVWGLREVIEARPAINN